MDTLFSLLVFEYSTEEKKEIEEEEKRIHFGLSNE